MKRLAVALCSVLLLGGCTTSEEDLPNRILTQLEQLPSMKLTAGMNMDKEYYSYYLPKGIGRRDSNTLSEVFNKDGYRLVMNFDPSAIIISNYYQTKSDETDASINDTFMMSEMSTENDKYTYTGNYITNENDAYPYTLQVVKSDSRYLLYMDGAVVKLYTYVPQAEVASSLKAMVRIMSSVAYDETAILQDYSIKSIGDTNKKSIEYLQENLPSSGSLQELLNGREEYNGPSSGDSTE